MSSSRQNVAASPFLVAKSLENASGELALRVAEHEATIRGAEILRVLVGDGDPQAEFFVHRELFVRRSACVARCITPSSPIALKTATFCVSLKGQQPDDFRRYVNLLYANQLVTKGPEEWTKLCRLYVLCMELQDLQAVNLVLDGMHALFLEKVTPNLHVLSIEEVLPASATKTLYEQTAAGNQARKLIVDLYVESGRAEWLREGQHVLPQDFIYDVALRFMQRGVSKMFGSAAILQPASWYHAKGVLFGHGIPAFGRANHEQVDSCTRADMATAKRSIVPPTMALPTPDLSPKSVAPVPSSKSEEREIVNVEKGLIEKTLATLNSESADTARREADKSTTTRDPAATVVITTESTALPIGSDPVSVTTAATVSSGVAPLTPNKDSNTPRPTPGDQPTIPNKNALSLRPQSLSLDTPKPQALGFQFGRNLGTTSRESSSKDSNLTTSPANPSTSTLFTQPSSTPSMFVTLGVQASAGPKTPRGSLFGVEWETVPLTSTSTAVGRTTVSQRGKPRARLPSEKRDETAVPGATDTGVKA
ncbi:hypothetical protein NX059_003556 [Plenodomus lindquistii]|nr:hypothetical protein NX059_003556 [Plenodomus lindquistii]